MFSVFPRTLTGGSSCTASCSLVYSTVALMAFLNISKKMWCRWAGTWLMRISPTSSPFSAAVASRPVSSSSGHSWYSLSHRKAALSKASCTILMTSQPALTVRSIQRGSRLWTAWCTETRRCAATQLVWRRSSSSWVAAAVRGEVSASSATMACTAAAMVGTVPRCRLRTLFRFSTSRSLLLSLNSNSAKHLKNLPELFPKPCPT